MEAILNSLLLVSFSEIGDKTQLLAFVLASRYKKTWPILWGILLATLCNHYLAAYLGNLAVLWIAPEYRNYLLASLFVIFGLWILKPDEEGDLKTMGRWGAFLVSFVSFFLAEMGDKTQLATVALGAQYNNNLYVTIGSTLGMMLANAPAVFMGDKLLKRIPLKSIRYFSAFLFLVFAVYILLKDKLF